MAPSPYMTLAVDGMLKTNKLAQLVTIIPLKQDRSFISLQTKDESGVKFHPIFTKFAPLHSRRRLECSLGSEQTSFLMEVCECPSEKDNLEAVTLAKVTPTEGIVLI